MHHDIYDLRFFVTLTESGSLAEAARRLDVTPSAVSQRLQQLESRLGVQLAHRSTRRFSLTEEGLLLQAGAGDLLQGLEGLIDSLRARSQRVTGTLHVCGPLGFGRRYLAEAVAAFHEQHPALTVSLTLSDVVAPADTNRYDLIVHIGQLADSSVVAFPIAPNQRFICASPRYLAERPAPREPKELAGHHCIALRENDEDVTLWRLRKKRSETAVRVRAVLSSNDGDVVKQWALAGKGLVLRSEWDVAENVARGELVRVLADWTAPDADVVALTARRAGLSARARLFLGFLQDRFQPAPPWREALATLAGKKPKKGTGAAC